MAKSRTKKLSAATKPPSKTKPGASKGGSVQLPVKSGTARPPTRSAIKQTSARSANIAGGEAGLGGASPSPMASVVLKRVAPRFEIPTPPTPERWLGFLNEAVGELVWLTRLERIDPSVWDECCDRIELGCAAVDPSIVSMSPEEAAVGMRPRSAAADREGLRDDLALLVEISAALSGPEPLRTPSECSNSIGVQHVPHVALAKADRELAGLVSSLRAIVYRARTSASLDPTVVDRLGRLADELRQFAERRYPKADATAAAQSSRLLADQNWLESTGIPKSLRRKVDDLSRDRADRREPKIPTKQIGAFRCFHVPSLVRALRPELSKINHDYPNTLPRAVVALL